MKTSVTKIMMSIALMGCLIFSASDASAQGRSRSQGGSTSSRSQSAAVSRSNSSSAPTVSRSSSSSSSRSQAAPQVNRSNSTTSRSQSTPQVNRSNSTTSRSQTTPQVSRSTTSPSTDRTHGAPSSVDRRDNNRPSTVTTPSSSPSNRGTRTGGSRSHGGDNGNVDRGGHNNNNGHTGTSDVTRPKDNTRHVTTSDKNVPSTSITSRGDAKTENDRRSGKPNGGKPNGGKPNGGKPNGGHNGGHDGVDKDHGGKPNGGHGNGNGRGHGNDRHGYDNHNHYDYTGHHYHNDFHRNYTNHNWSRPLPPPARPYRPAPYVWYRPVIPAGWVPYAGAPVIDRILGITFGTFFDTSLDYLYYNGYYIDGYADHIIYLRDVPLLNLIWDDVMLCYDDGNRLVNAQFIFVTPSYSTHRYDRVYRSLCRVYGQPVASTSEGISWYGGNSTGWVTLSMNSNLGHYYTTLSIGY